MDKEISKQTFLKTFSLGIPILISEASLWPVKGFDFYTIVKVFYTMSVKILSVMAEIFYFILYVLVSNWNKLSFKVLVSPNIEFDAWISFSWNWCGTVNTLQSNSLFNQHEVDVLSNNENDSFQCYTCN